MTARHGWRDIATDLRREITGGQLQPGERLPEQRELANRYGVSRATVARAIRALADEGLVRSSRGGGTHVAPPPVKLAITRYGAVAQPTRPRPDLGPWETACSEQGVPGRVELLRVARETATGEVARRLAVLPGTPVVRRSRRMWAGGDVLQVQTAWYPAAIVEGTAVAESGRVDGGVYAALVTSGITPAVADEEITAQLPAGAAEASTELGLGASQPLLNVWRTTRDTEGRVIEAVHTLASGTACTYLYTGLPIQA